MAEVEIKIKPYLDQIQSLEFVKDLQFSAKHQERDMGIDGVLTLCTANGMFGFAVEQKRSYLDRALLNAFISQAKSYAASNRKPLLLLARYVPRPSAERLIQAGINFVDEVGNMNLVLGKKYARTIIGNREPSRVGASRAITPAKVKLLFAFVAYSLSPEWTVRQLAEASGLSKSNVAKIRKELVEEGILKITRGAFEPVERKKIELYLIRGYEQVLRPKLLINRFRALESSPQSLLEKMKDTLDDLSIKWSITGGPAANGLQHFYRGDEVPVFVSHFSENAIRQLRLLPDKTGPLIILRAFGKLPYWKEVAGKTIAHPWLIYCELMHSSDPRAHEAAEQLKSEFLRDA